MSRHRAEAAPQRWPAHGGAALAGALAIALGVLVVGQEDGPLIQPGQLEVDSACVPTATTSADGRTWHGCAP